MKYFIVILMLFSLCGILFAQELQQNPTQTVKRPLRLNPEGFRLGLTVGEVETFYDHIFDQDFVPLYKKASVGPQMKALDAQLAETKAGFRRSKVNLAENEMMMKLTRKGINRYFVFYQGKLWKFYDAIPLSQNQGEIINPWCNNDCSKWSSFQGAVTYLNQNLGVAGQNMTAGATPQLHKPLASSSRPVTVAVQKRKHNEVDWFDRTINIRLIDRSPTGLIGLAIEDRVTANQLANRSKSEEAIDFAH